MKAMNDRNLSASAHAVKRVMSRFYAINGAVRFNFALRFSFFGFWVVPGPICENCAS